MSTLNLMGWYWAYRHHSSLKGQIRARQENYDDGRSPRTFDTVPFGHSISSIL